MKNEWHLGDEVEISFVGTIVGMELFQGKPRYQVDAGDEVFSPYDQRVKESMIYPLKQDNNPDHERS